jgi:hypothetical protein
MPPGTVYVGRPSRWGNPFKVGGGVSRAEAVRRFREWFMGHPELVEVARRELRGRDLACWCRLDEPCHADVLLEVANS